MVAEDWALVKCTVQALEPLSEVSVTLLPLVPVKVKVPAMVKIWPWVKANVEPAVTSFKL